MLKNKQSTSNSLFHDDEEAKKDRQQIYVPLALVERKKPDKREGGFFPEQGTKLYEPQYEEKQRFEHDAFLAQILAQGEGKTQGKRIALIGEPGAGKTTLLQEIADWALQQKLGLPVWISMADFATQTGTLSDFWEYLQKTWLKRAVTEPKGVRQNFKEQFDRGRVWLLLDGVDEVATSGGKTLQAIDNQLKGWVGKARVVLTCRLNVWQGEVNALSEFETYRLLDFDYPQQVHQFIDNWFAPSPDKSLEGKGERLKAELDKAELRIRDLVQNPLRLALLCGTWQLYEGNLPETKAGLYGQFVQLFYRWKSERFPISPQKQGELNKALGRLALKDIDSGGGRFRLEEGFISEELGDPKDENSLCYLALQLGWLNIVGVAAESTKKKVYAFFHATFEEYFAARAIDNWDYLLPRQHKNKPVKGKQYRIFEPQWKQIFLLWLGREDVDEEQKEQFIKALIEFDDGCGQFKRIKEVGRGFYEYRAYFIAVAGIAEFRDCTKADKIVKQIVNWGCDNFLYKICKKARDNLVETDRSKTIATLVQLLQSSKNKKTRMPAAYILGQIGGENKKAIAALVQLLRSSKNATSRWLVAESLGNIDPENKDAIAALVQLLRSSKNDWLAAGSLENIYVKNKDAIAALVQLLKSSKNEKTRRLAAEILGKIDPENNEAVAALVQLSESSKSEDTRIKAADSLESIGGVNKKAIAALVQLIESSKNEYTRYRAAEKLEEIDPGNQHAIAALVQLLRLSKNEHIFWRAAYILGKIDPGNQEAIAASVKLLRLSQYEYSQNEYICWIAAESLGNIDPGNQEANAALVQLLKSSKNEYICRFAAESLGRIDPGNQEAIAALVQLLRSSKSEKTRRLVAESLGEILQDNQKAKIGAGNQEAIAALVQLLRSSKSEKTRRLVAESLEEILQDNQKAKIGAGNQEAIAALVQLLRSSKSEQTRRLVAESLGEILQDNQKAEVVTALKDCLSAKGYKNNPDRFKECYELIWDYAQTLPYPEFYQAWHKSERLSWHKSELLSWHKSELPYLVHRVFQR